MVSSLGACTSSHGALEVLVVADRADLEADEHEAGEEVAARGGLAPLDDTQESIDRDRGHKLR